MISKFTWVSSAPTASSGRVMASRTSVPRPGTSDKAWAMVGIQLIKTAKASRQMPAEEAILAVKLLFLVVNFGSG